MPTRTKDCCGARGRDQVEHRLDVHRRTVPSPYGEAAARRDGAGKRRARPRPDRLGRCRPRPGRVDPVGVRPQEAVRRAREHALRPRAAPPRRGVRRSPGCPPGPARGTVRFRAPSRRRRHGRRSSRSGNGAPLAAQPARARGDRRVRVPRSGRPRAARRRAGVVPRCRARLDRDLRRRASRRRRSTTVAAATSLAHSC